MPNAAPAVPCAQAALDAGEPIYATATRKTDIWLLVEHDGQWAPQILDSPSLDPAIRAVLEAFLEDQPRARVQLIRAADGSGDADRALRLFFATSGEDDAAIWEFTYRTADDLQALDLRALAADPTRCADARRTSPLFLVCTHGKRDACCARGGPPVFRALSRDWRDAVWQTSHIGGHRFAATMLCFPGGHCFGRLDPGAARRVAQSYAAGTITELDRYRGRTTYAHPVQAAEWFLRQAIGAFSIDALRYTRGEIAGDERWNVCFHDRTAGQTHELTIVKELSDDCAPPSCGKPPAPIARYRLEAHRQMHGADTGR